MAAQMISNIIRVTENCPTSRLHSKRLFVKKDQRKKQSRKKTKQIKTKQNKNKNKTKQNKTKQNKTKQNKTKQNKTKQNKTKQNKTTVLPRSLSCLCFLPTMYVTCTCFPYPITSFVIKTLTPAADWTAIAPKSQCYFDSSLVLRFLSGPLIPLWSFDSSLNLWFLSGPSIPLWSFDSTQKSQCYLDS